MNSMGTVALATCPSAGGFSPSDYASLGARMAETAIGKKRWAIAEGYLPGWSHGPEPQMKSHETACLLNTTEHEAQVRITVYFSNRDPSGPYRIMVPARRTRHVRFNELSDP